MSDERKRGLLVDPGFKHLRLAWHSPASRLGSVNPSGIGWMTFRSPGTLLQPAGDMINSAGLAFAWSKKGGHDQSVRLTGREADVSHA